MIPCYIERMDQPKIIKRAQAKKEGLSRYFTGKPCKNGHISERQVSHAVCLACMAIWAANYRQKNLSVISEKAKAYRIANPEKVATWKENSKPKRKIAEKIRQQRDAEKLAEYRRANKERIAEWHRKNYLKNRAEIIAKNQQYWDKNPEKRQQLSKSYYEANKPRYLAAWAKRKSNKLKATPKWANFDKIRAIYSRAHENGMHVDHIIPLQNELVCGLHVHNNLQELTPLENMSKGNKFNPADHEWSIK